MEYAGPKYSCEPVPVHLREFVRRYLYVESDVDLHFDNRPVATGCIYLGYLFSGDAWCEKGGEVSRTETGLHFCCQIEHSQFDVSYRGRVGHLTLEFSPTGLYRLFGVAGSEVNTLWHDANQVIGPRRSEELLDRLRNTTTKGGRMGAMNSYLEELSRKALPPVRYVDTAVSMIERSGGQIRINDICEELSVTERHLSRVFSDVVGVRPKFYARCVQLNEFLAVLLESPSTPLGVLAKQCGYYDHAHLTRSLRQLVGDSPTHFTESSQARILSSFIQKNKAPA